MLCPIFGLIGSKWALYQSSLSSLWGEWQPEGQSNTEPLTVIDTGSWAFVIGSILQWYESLSKHPVEKMKDA